MIDQLIGAFLRLCPPIRGRARLRRWWIYRPRPPTVRRRRTPSGRILRCDWSVPYEAVAWLGDGGLFEDVPVAARRLSPGGVFLDVGANVGLWSVECTAAVGPGGRIFAFEPNPVTVEKLRANVAANGLELVITVFPLALSDREGMATLSCPHDHDTSRLSDAGGAPGIAVRTAPLDALFSPDQPVHGIKVDVEGHELKFLEGARHLIERCHPWIVIEFNLDHSAADRLSDWSVHQWLSARDYRPFSLLPERPIEDPETFSPRPARYLNLLYR